MQHKLAPADRNLLIFAGLLIAALSAAAAVIYPQNAPSLPGSASSYSTADDGAKAAYLLLKASGYRVVRWDDPPQDLPGIALSSLPEGSETAAMNTVLILAQPQILPSAEEEVSIANFVRRGGRVLIAGAGPGMLVPEGSGKGAPLRETFSKTYAAELPAPLTRKVPEIEMAARSRWGKISGHQLRYFGDSYGATVASFSLGKGEVIWWADAGPLTNAGISQSSNLVLLLNSVGGKNSRVLWDEYFHGYRAGLWSYLKRTPVPWSLVQVALLLVAALIAFGRRRGPIRKLRPASRLSPLEFVETLGDLYRQKGAASEALAIADHRFRFLLAGRLGLPAKFTSADIQRGVRERLGWAVPGFSETVARCDLGVKDSHLTAARSLHLIQELHDYTRRFGLSVSQGGKT